MDYLAILTLIQKGLTVAQAIYDAGKDAAPAIQAISALVTGAQNGTVTDDELTQTEALLDSMIQDFNAPV